MHVTVESTGHGEPPSTDDEADVSIALASVAVLVATAVSVTVLLLVRRGAPDGSYFNDGDRAAGVFGVLATSFSILLGFIVFLAFTSYDDSRRGAEDEALAVVQQFETAQFLPAATGHRPADELVCYARSVVYGEWPKMQDGTRGDEINPWGVALFRTIDAADPALRHRAGGVLEVARPDLGPGGRARTTRRHAADGIIPTPLWVVLFLIAAVIFVFMLFFADSGERRSSRRR